MASIGKFVRKLRSDAQLAALIVTRENPSSIFHAIRTAVAAVVSLLIARLFRLPEAYWSSILQVRAGAAADAGHRNSKKAFPRSRDTQADAA
jgi:hypothetical protein